MDNATTTAQRTGGDTCDPIPHPRPITDYLHRTCYLEPSRTGGGDHSLRADIVGVDPMIFGGRRFQHDALCDPRRSLIIRRVVQVGGWIARRDWTIRANYLSPSATRDAEVCMGMVVA